MGINLSVPDQTELKPKILVLGVGGAGGNAVNNMINAELQGVDFVVANTDAQALKHSSAERKIQLGAELTEGLGAGSKPQIGGRAAEEALEEITAHLRGVHMCFITAGMGGGTGTGAAPVIAQAAREQGILTVGVVTKPFQFEGNHRMRIADAGIDELQKYVDTLIIIPNQNLFRIANEKTTFADAFNMADDVLHSGVRGVTDLMVMPGLINLDFADVNTVMNEMGKAMMGTGEASGENRAIEAAEAAISNPLLDDVSMKGARGVLINITGGMDLTLYELDEAANRIRSEVDPEANIIVGSTFDTEMEGVMRVSVVATGIDNGEIGQKMPTNVTSILKVTAEGAASQTPRTVPAAPVGMPSAASISAASIAVNPTGPTGQPVAQMSPEVRGEGDEGAKGFSGMTTGTADVMSPAGNLALSEPELNLLHDDDSMESSKPEARNPEAKEDPFLAPRPMERKTKAEKFSAPDSFREAEMVNASAPKRRRGPSLFERMTGVGRAARKAEVEAGEAPSATKEKRQEPVPEPQQSIDEKPAQQAPIAPQSPPAEAAMTAGDKPDMVAKKQVEEDLLDIPAFLRRQAN